MKLDATVMRTMERSDFLLLEAVESAMKDHYIVPLNVITATAQLRHGGVQTVLRGLLRDKLLSHERKGGREGFRLTNSGYDILALYHLKKRNVIAALGQKIGTGKESDIYLAATPAGQQVVLKFHRLGRTSFRNVKQKRDYIRPTTSSSSGSSSSGMMSQHSWLFLSKLSAAKEWSFLSALHKVHYPTPVPLAHNRHVIAMSLVRGTPLYQIYPKTVSADQAAAIYRQVAALAARLAQVHGLVHCDLNEFNLLVDLSGIQSLATDDTNDAYVRHSGYSVVDPKSIRSEGILSKPAWEQSLLEPHHGASEPLPEPKERLANGEPKPVVTLIDFPQMISTQHPNAQELFERDMDCLQRFFETKLKCPVPVTDQVRWDDIMAARRRRRGRTSEDVDDEDDDENDGTYEDVSERLDRELRASGFSLHDNQQLELYYFESGLKPIASAVDVVIEEEEDDYDVESASSSSSDNVDADAPLNDSSKRQEEDSPQRHANMVMIDTSAAAALHGPARHDCNTISGEGSAAHTRSSIRTLTREELQVIAQERVQKQLGDQKRKARLRGAYRKQNSNKNYEKGRRVVAESLAM